MGDGQLGLFGGGGDERPGAPATPPTELTEEELQARREAQRLPVGQQALNIVGLAQARNELAAGRAATLRRRPAGDQAGERVKPS